MVATKQTIQYAVLPYRRRADRRLEVLLITSRETRRWIIPKGWPIGELPPHESAAREAMEEAGVVGRVLKTPIGFFLYDKRLDDGSTIRCRVKVFAMRVERRLSRWLEKKQRETRWMLAGDAAKAVDEPGLRNILRSLGARLR
jgi:8-oxo-dGTP pyrophosphatase MutT (NUDIX family)